MEKDPAEPHRLTTLVEVTNQLLKDGYSESFVLTENGLTANSTKEIIKPNQLKIVKHYRFEGTTDPADMSVVFAVETESGLRGIIVSGYGPNADELTEFMKFVNEVPNPNNPNGYNYDGIINTTYK